MEIKTNKQVVSGEHNGTKFSLDGGVLHIFGTTWDKSDLKTLIEVANLLHLQGFPIQEKKEAEKRNGFVYFTSSGGPWHEMCDDEDGE